jgi:hypothetical protein
MTQGFEERIIDARSKLAEAIRKTPGNSAYVPYTLEDAVGAAIKIIETFVEVGEEIGRIKSSLESPNQPRTDRYADVAIDLARTQLRPPNCEHSYKPPVCICEYNADGSALIDNLDCPVHNLGPSKIVDEEGTLKGVNPFPPSMFERMGDLPEPGYEGKETSRRPPPLPTLTKAYEDARAKRDEAPTDPIREMMKCPSCNQGTNPFCNHPFHIGETPTGGEPMTTEGSQKSERGENGEREGAAGRTQGLTYHPNNLGREPYITYWGVRVGGEPETVTMTKWIADVEERLADLEEQQR